MGPVPFARKERNRPPRNSQAPRADQQQKIAVLEQELARVREQQRATAHILRAISASRSDLQAVLKAVAENSVRLCGADVGQIFRIDGDLLRAVASYGPIPSRLVGETMRITRRSVAGRAVVDRQAVHVRDLSAELDTEFPDAKPYSKLWGHRTTLATPLLREDGPIGAIFIRRTEVRPFSDNEITLFQTFADQAVIAIENARLLRELEEKGHQLETASRHKSEFLANMSHELRTPLNAIMGFSEVLAEGMFGEVNEKQVEYLRDILESGRHLLSLINDILDLSKIEAGRMDLRLEDVDLPGAIDNALTLVRERARRRGIALGRVIDDRVGVIRADERKVRQVLLNLLSNALKFTPEGGRIDVRAAVAAGMVEVSVADTGVGIAAEDQEAVFEEFRQVATADKKVEGTGLGLALARKFIELHGGRIWVKSQLGQGSTFTFTLPARRGE
jgi:signal transduction histidine kinase